jgi:5-methylthioadenosine/S-adenosylhomocysteine deaminase
MGKLIHNALVVTVDPEWRIWRRGAVAVEDGRIVDVGPEKAIAGAYGGFERLNAGGKLVLPGFINSHSHTVLAGLRSMTEDLGRRSLYDIYGPFEELMTKEDKVLMSMLGTVETLKSGTTCLVENYFEIEPLVGFLDEVGIRAVISDMIRDVDWIALKERTYRFDSGVGEKNLQRGVDLVEKWHGHDEGRITCQLSPHAPDLCSAGLLRRIREAAEKLDVRVHTHVCQNPMEVEQTFRREGKTPVQFLDSIGLVSPRVIGAHCFLADTADVSILGRSGFNVAHCPGIAARRGYAPPVWQLKQAGANVVLGSDNMTGDMMEAMRLALMIARIRYGEDTAMNSVECLRAATIQGARALGLEDEIGSLEKGKRADILIVDLKKAHLVPVIDPVVDLVHYGLASDVDTVMVNGRLLMEKRKLKTIDEEELLNEAQDAGERLWAEFRRRYNLPAVGGSR